MPEICAIILAAGESTRMGANKLLLPWHGHPIIRVVIENVMQTYVDHILVVLGAFREEILPIIKEMPVRHCYNSFYKQGMLSSVQCGFRNLPDSVDAAMIFLGDQPMISGAVAKLLIEEYRKSKTGMLVPTYKGKRGHPVLIDKKYKNAIEKLDPAEGLRALFYHTSEDIQEVEADEPGILRDIDTLQDYNDENKLK
jgi:molybdenum cofactor cytidylyltransferase